MDISAGYFTGEVSMGPACLCFWPLTKVIG